jgi:RNA polymerase sigma-70 factor (ECF subfamily)
MTGNPNDALDLTQETFLKAWQRIGSFRGESAVYTWLHSICSRLCIDFLRRQKNRPGDELDEGFADSSPGPDELAENAELRGQLQAALERLSPAHRQVLLLREISGLSYGQIARSLRVSEGTVKSRIARAREHMRLLLLESGNYSGAGGV